MKGKLTRAMTTFHSVTDTDSWWLMQTHILCEHTYSVFRVCCALGHNSYLLTLRGKGMHYSLNLQYFFTHARYKN